MTSTNNIAVLTGTSCADARLSHSGRNEVYYTFPMAVSRLSGAVDTVNVIVRQSVVNEALMKEGARLKVTGQLRSFNNKSGSGNKLVITLFARRLEPAGGEDENHVELIGTLCKAPSIRQTPMGREICDLMIAVNRKYGRSDYLPCIAWGSVARKASLWEIGTRVSISGRMQSRRYIKEIDGVPVEKTAFEVSVSDIELSEPIQPAGISP